MSKATNRIAVLHGVNFDVLEKRDPDLYSGLSLAELEYKITGFANEFGLEPIFFQSNSETDFCGYLHRLSETADGAIINAGAWSHYSRAIGDAFGVDPVPAVEVHLSDVENRDEWRKVSVFEGQVEAKISGKGVDGYREALSLLADRLSV